MFADDLILLSDSALGLQNCLTELEKYCRKWKLTVNIKKTKILIFNKGGHIIKRFKFYLDDSELETVTNYCYLGIVFSSSGNFNLAMENLYEKARKALFKLKQYNLKDDVKTAFKLFNALILPILRYGSEVWAPFQLKGLNSNNFLNLCDKVCIEKINNSFCKYLLGVNRYSSNYAVKGELGSYSLIIKFILHATKYWLAMCDSDRNSLVYLSYLENCKDLKKTTNFNWCTHIKRILTEFNMKDVWDNQGTKYKSKIVRLMKENMYLRYETDWKAHINSNSSKLKTYCKIKYSFALENYILTKPLRERKYFTKLRISAHKLNIESGRYTIPKTPANLRFCPFCPDQVESEMHLVLNCSKYQDLRNDFFNSINYINLPSNDEEKFVFLMTHGNGDMEIFNDVNAFVNNCFLLREDHT